MPTSSKSNPGKLLRKQIESRLAELINEFHGTKANPKDAQRKAKKAAKLLAQVELRKEKEKKPTVPAKKKKAIVAIPAKKKRTAVKTARKKAST